MRISDWSSDVCSSDLVHARRISLNWVPAARDGRAPGKDGMAYTGQLPRRQRMIAGGGALIAALLVGIGLASGLDLNVVRTAAESISAFALPAPPPPESPRPVERAPDSTAAKAAPPNKPAQA